MKRRDFFRTAGVGAFVSPALVDALAGPAWARSAPKPGGLPTNPFIVLLQGTYEPVVRCPDLGLLLVDPCDGTYSTTKIFPVSGLPEGIKQSHHGNRQEDRGCEGEKAIGDFYVALGMGGAVAYDLPGGTIAMTFTGNNLVPVPDGHEGTFRVGTIDLVIIEATGIYEAFVGGQNKMVDILYRLPDGSLLEHCYCIISH
jgi:hypothetical protein